MEEIIITDRTGTHTEGSKLVLKCGKVRINDIQSEFTDTKAKQQAVIR